MAHRNELVAEPRLTSLKRLSSVAGAGAIFVGVSLLRLFVVSMLAATKDQTLDDVLGRWDAVHYISIARGGYFEDMNPNSLGGYQTRLAFFPLFPFLLRLTHEITRLDYLAAGLFLNTIAGVAMVYAAMLLAKHMGAARRGQFAAGVLIAGVPMGITFNMPYTEALFGAFSLWALLFMLQRRWLLAGVFVFFTCLTRITGVDLWIVFACVVVIYGRKTWRSWLALALSPLGMVTYILFVNSRTAELGGYFGLQKKGWGSAFDFGKSTMNYFSWIFTRTGDSWVVIIGLFILGTVAMVILSFGKLPWPVWLFAAGVAANILLSDGTFTARPRLLLPVFICLLPLALAAGKSFDRIRLGLLSVFWVIFGAVIAAHPLIATTWAI